MKYKIENLANDKLLILYENAISNIKSLTEKVYESIENFDLEKLRLEILSRMNRGLK
jgi:hypothetical protein